MTHNDRGGSGEGIRSFSSPGLPVWLVTSVCVVSESLCVGGHSTGRKNYPALTTSSHAEEDC